jgi:hypothetical protein
MTGFVDDTTLFCNDFRRCLDDEASVPTLFDNTTRSAQWWEELLHATGGKLELSKCWTNMLIWKFDDNGRSSLLAPEELPAIKIFDSNSQAEMEITSKAGSDAHRTLGTMETPSGDYLAEHKRLYDKARLLATKLSTATVNRQEARTFYFSMAAPALTYSLPTGTLSKKKCEDIQGPLITALLPALGYNPNTMRSLVHGPTDAMGIGIPSLFSEQGALKLKLLFQQLRSP